jgi:hypothetical protein
MKLNKTWEVLQMLMGVERKEPAKEREAVVLQLEVNH